MDNDEIKLAKKLIEEYGWSDRDHSTLLLLATSVGQLSVVKYAISLGQNATNMNSALECSLNNEQFKIAKYLVSVGAKLQISVYDMIKGAMQKRSLKEIKYIISISSDPFKDIWRLVYHAAKIGYLDFIKYLVSVGIDLEITGADTALIVAAENNHQDIVKFILPYCAASSRMTAFEQAIRHEYVSIVSYFVSVCDDRINQIMFNAAVTKGYHKVFKCFVLAGYLHRMLDPYDYISILDTRHLRSITNRQIRRVIIILDNRLRIMQNNTQYLDIIIVTV